MIAKVTVAGHPAEDISTSYIERQNMQLRQCIKRMSRLTNAYSKKKREPTPPLRFTCFGTITARFTVRSENASHGSGLTQHVWTSGRDDRRQWPLPTNRRHPQDHRHASRHCPRRRGNNPNSLTCSIRQPDQRRQNITRHARSSSPDQGRVVLALSWDSHYRSVCPAFAPHENLVRNLQWGDSELCAG